MKPLPSEASPQLRDLLQSMRRRSASSGSADPAAVPAAAHDTAASKRPLVKVGMNEWWLATVEGDDQKIAVAGTYMRKKTLLQLPPTPIVKRHSPTCLETEDGTMLEINSRHDFDQSLGNGYSETVCDHFALGFPYWWQSCNQRYPKLKNSDTRCQPRSAKTRKSKKFQQKEDLDSVLADVMSRHPDIFRSASRNVSVFPESSHLSNGAPRFEEYTCGGDVATNKNVVTSSEAAKGDPRTPRTCNGDIATNKNIVTSSEAANDHQRTPITCDRDIATNENVVTSSEAAKGDPRTPVTCNGNIATNKNVVTSSEAVNGDQRTPDTCVHDIATNENVVTSSGAANGDPRTPVTCDRDIATNENVVTSSEAANGDKRTLVVALEVCGYRKETQHKSLAEKTIVDKEMRASNKKRVGRPKKQISPQDKCRGATRSARTRSLASSAHCSPLTCGKATPLSMSTPEALKLKRSRSGRVLVPKLDQGYQSISYGRDGLIAGVIGLDSPAMPKLSEPKTGRRKKRRTE